MTYRERQSKSTKNHFTKGDVLYGKLRPYLNKVIIADKEGYCTTEIIPLRPNEAIDGRYLFYWLKHPVFLDYVTAVSHGLNMPRLGTKAGLDAPLLLAPLAEQKRIADKLDALLARVDGCRARLARVPAILKRFRQAVLAAATSGALTADWREGRELPKIQPLLNNLKHKENSRRGVAEFINEANEISYTWNYPAFWGKATAAMLLMTGVFEDLKDGNHGSNHPRVSDFTTEGMPFITAAQVANYKVDYDGAYKVSGEPLALLRVGFAKPNDVVLTHKGTVGRVALIDRECVLTPQTTYYRSNTNYVIPKYLMYYMASPVFTNQLDEIKSQTTRDFVPISQQYGLIHLIPPIQEQHEIVRRVEILFDYADRLETRYATAAARVEQLTPALLAKAFRGELVAQDPADEPTSLLLARLRAAQAEINLANRKTPQKSTVDMKITSRNTPTYPISVVQALRDAGKELSSEELLIAAGYPPDADAELIEDFLVAVREAMDTHKVTKVRRNNKDWFSVAK